MAGYIENVSTNIIKTIYFPYHYRMIEGNLNKNYLWLGWHVNLCGRSRKTRCSIHQPALFFFLLNCIVALRSLWNSTWFEILLRSIHKSFENYYLVAFGKKFSFKLANYGLRTDVNILQSQINHWIVVFRDWFANIRQVITFSCSSLWVIRELLYLKKKCIEKTFFESRLYFVTGSSCLNLRLKISLTDNKSENI